MMSARYAILTCERCFSKATELYPRDRKMVCETCRRELDRQSSDLRVNIIVNVAEDFPEDFQRALEYMQLKSS